MPETVIRATFDPASLRPRILHIGFGAFARAHLMVYLQEGLNAAGGDWGVVACRLHSGVEELSALDKAGRRYLVAEIDGNGVTAREIAVVVGTCHPGRDGIDSLLDLIASEPLSVISLTITEKGYCCRNGQLDLDHKGIRADLENPENPKTAIGVIVAGLARRRAAGLSGLTVLSCDNQPDNGRLVRTAVLAFAHQRDGRLADWIDAHVTFPGTMVDRVVPALDDEGRALLKNINGGRADDNGIVCEPFRQWVIEDDFAAGRPPYAEGGAMLTDDVRPFEMMKLRMLNGAHTFLAMLGSLAGLETVDACMADPVFRKAARSLMLDEQRPTLPATEGVDIEAYADDLIARFANPKLKHRTGQIAWDTSQKLPQRLLHSVEENIEAGRPFPLLALAVAGWMRFVKLTAESGGTLTDPLADQLLAMARDREGEALVDGLIAIDTVFDADLAAHPAFRAAILKAYDSIVENGPREAVAIASR
ncbi:mannitol dehydrogenase family protein [Martelella mediterranea]|uniref:mannitol dehydrogenase family protein n=1 Tax=Martelella mediterranea TaxID=293089 RepID=UPI001E2B9151|nr:mannitol dehydrogenase family protein [Martelella mediterranea]MCD1636598.1 mannitol dehydrogenase family protein [Martelella mediterranea]